MKARTHWTAVLERFAHDELPGEEWREVVGAPGYMVSNLGRVLSTRPLNGRGTKSGPPRILQATTGPCGRRAVYVMEPRRGAPSGSTAGSDQRRMERRIGNLVSAAFIGPMPASATHLRYLNGDGRDDRLENIAYGTWDDVLADHAARARREEAAGAPTRCPDGHRYADLYLQNYGNRLCRECNRLACAQRYRESGAVWNERARQATIAARAARGPRLSECVDCGAEVLNVDSGGTFKRCEPCRRAKELEKQRRRNEQRRAERLANPRQRITICVDCEAEIHHTAPSGPLSQRCEVCAKRRRRERQREYDRRRAKSPASRIKAS